MCQLTHIDLYGEEERKGNRSVFTDLNILQLQRVGFVVVMVIVTVTTMYRKHRQTTSRKKMKRAI